MTPCGEDNHEKREDGARMHTLFFGSKYPGWITRGNTKLPNSTRTRKPNGTFRRNDGRFPGRVSALCRPLETSRVPRDNDRTSEFPFSELGGRERGSGTGTKWQTARKKFPSIERDVSGHFSAHRIATIRVAELAASRVGVDAGATLGVDGGGRGSHRLVADSNQGR